MGGPLAWLVLPLLLCLVDCAAGIRARRVRRHEPVPTRCDDFSVLVPIYGSLRYLENVEQLAQYGERVILCTTTTEDRDFLTGLHAIAAERGFAVFEARVDRRVDTGRRATGGTTRDTIVQRALAHVRTPYVVCLDADTTTTRPLEELVGELVDRELDIASVQLVVANPINGIAKLQAHEYRMAMLLRLVAPWLVSGACHAGRTAALRHVMRKHSLFFQGNDVEVGVLGRALGYEVGHARFEVPTAVPSTLHGWWRQRWAWSGGEFRLFVVNIRLLLAHPFFWAYGTFFVIAMLPWRWWEITDPGRALIVIPFAYYALVYYLNWQHRDRWLLLLPLYMGLNAMVVTAFGLVSYVGMARASGNRGVIRWRDRSPDAQLAPA